MKFESGLALNLFRKILKSNIGARYYILTIRKNMPLEEFTEKFEAHEGPAREKWFRKHKREFPEEFAGLSEA